MYRVHPIHNARERFEGNGGHSTRRTWRRCRRVAWLVNRVGYFGWLRMRIAMRRVLVHSRRRASYWVHWTTLRVVSPCCRCRRWDSFLRVHRLRHVSGHTQLLITVMYLCNLVWRMYWRLSRKIGVRSSLLWVIYRLRSHGRVVLDVWTDWSVRRCATWRINGPTHCR